MKISIETKFNIGDTVYVAECYYDFYAQKQPYIITDILINTNSKVTNILYEIKQDGFTDRVPEHLLFSTYEECTKWCKKHN